MAVTIDDKILSNFINGYYTFIITNLNLVAALCSFNSCIQSIIRLNTSLCNNLRNKRPYRRSRSRSQLTAAVVSGFLYILGITASVVSGFLCILGVIVAVVSEFLYILGVIAAVVSGFLCILGAAVCRNIYIHSLLTVLTVAYHVYNIIRGVGCSIAVRTFLRRKRGNRQHGQHHQSGEGTGKKTVISLFHAKNLLCVHTDAKEA